MPNDTFSFRPSDRQRDLISEYQADLGNPDEPLKKSEAISKLVNMGLAKHFGGLRVNFFWELSKMAIYVGLTMSLIWWWDGIGEFPVAVYIPPLTYIFVTMAVLSLVIHLSDFHPLGGFAGTDESKA